jgi:DNA-binding MarR family transcriptional regulator
MDAFDVFLNSTKEALRSEVDLIPDAATLSMVCPSRMKVANLLLKAAEEGKKSIEIRSVDCPELTELLKELWAKGYRLRHTRSNTRRVINYIEILWD